MRCFNFSYQLFGYLGLWIGSSIDF